MGKDIESTMKFKLDIKEFKANIQDAKRQISLANAEFKKNTSGANNWASSITGVEGKIKQLKTTLSSQKTILSQLQKEYDAVSKEMGEDSAEAQKLKVQITQQEAAINKTNLQLQQYNGKLNDLKAEEKESNSALSKLNSTIDSQKSKLENLKKEYQNAVLTYGKNSKEAKSLASEIENLSGELAKNKTKLSETEKASDSLDKSLDETGDSAKSAANGGFTVLKGALADLAASGIKAVISGIKRLVSEAKEAYSEYKEGADNVIKATGATGKAAEELEKSYKKVAKSVVGDFSDIGSALGEVSTRFGFTGEQLEDCSVQFLRFAKITGTDAKTAVSLVSRAMGDAGINADEYSSLLDELAAAAQKSGISIDKLTENLTKYGAPMRALGFDTKESIAIFSAWEKAGVNTEIAFSGMKKAISNWSKSGKDAREEFKKTLDEIANCPDIAQATTKAIEVFGAKAGPDLADAIKQGRFEYSEFLEVLENSEGTVSNTSRQMQDGAGKVKLAIQNAKADLGSFVRDMMKKYQPQIESAIKAISAAFKSFVEFVLKNGKSIVAVLKSIAVGFAAFKITGLVTSLISHFSKFFELLKVGKGIVTAFNAAMSANVLGLVIAGVAALSTLLISLWNNMEDAIKAQYGLTDAEREAIDAANELSEKYKELDESRRAQTEAVASEFAYLNELKEEYNSLIDSNGQVKAGYEERANFILSTLAEAMGLERSEIEQLIDSNGKLGDSIDQLVLKKKAEVMLSANEEAYTEAIKNRTDAYKKMIDAQDVLNGKEKEYKELQKKSNEVMKHFHKLMQTAPSAAQGYLDANMDVVRGAEEAKKAYEESKDSFEAAEDSWIGYNQTIENYEGMSSAIISGDVSKINQALGKLQQGFITAETGNRRSLERQVHDTEEHYQSLKKAIESNTPGVTQEMVVQAREMRDGALEELDKYEAKANEEGKQGAEGFAQGMNNWLSFVTGSAKNMVQAAKDGAESVDFEPSGKNGALGYIGGIKSLLEEARAAGKELARKAIFGLKEGQQEASPSKITRKSGVFFGEGYMLGMQDMLKPVAGAARDLASAAVQSLGNQMSENMREIGKESGNSLIGGLNEIAPRVNSAISSLKSGVISAKAAINLTPAAGPANFEGGKNQTVIFNQTIQSPKAVDRLTLYRETNFLLFGAKARLNHV